MSPDISIDVVIYSYKGKLLWDCVQSVINNTTHRINKIVVIDRHPLDRSKKFSEISEVEYVHIFWDFQASPIAEKNKHIRKSSAEYILVISDDVSLSSGWDDLLLKHYTDDIVLSGSGVLEVSMKDLFSIKKQYHPSAAFNLTQMVDRNFIFASNKVWQEIHMPVYLKYNGEEEVMSLSIISNGREIYSVPFNTYMDSNFRAFETLYSPFSLDHNYNVFVKIIKDPSNIKWKDIVGDPLKVLEFLDFHGIGKESINYLPFLNNDVDYDPNDMVIDDDTVVGGRRFITLPKSIH